jgi:hypothetical protein
MGLLLVLLLLSGLLLGSLRGALSLTIGACLSTRGITSRTVRGTSRATSTSPRPMPSATATTRTAATARRTIRTVTEDPVDLDRVTRVLRRALGDPVEVDVDRGGAVQRGLDLVAETAGLLVIDGDLDWDVDATGLAQRPVDPGAHRTDAVAALFLEVDQDRDLDSGR